MEESAPQCQLPSVEEEAVKRNTDCVYFLASPLTCKKGSECEYRHSDVARVNPRDCWFWLHGNCLNPKCGFRHPPLDGLLGTQTPTPTGPSAPMPQTLAAPTPHVPNASNKQGVACIFFQKGYCLKGDWCPFLHVPTSLSNKASPGPGSAPAAEPAATVKKASCGLDKSVQEKKALPMNVVKSVKDPPQEKQAVELESAPAALRNKSVMNRRVSQASGINESPGYSNIPFSNGIPEIWSSHVQKPHLLDELESINSKDAEEVSREPSPGFDVLVDDERRDSDYYPGEDRYVMSMEHEARNEYDVDYSADFNTIVAVDDKTYQDSLGYSPHQLHKGGHYAWEQHRALSYHERRPYDGAASLGQVDKFDLRQRLAKHKKPNGLRSVISHEHTHDLQVGDRSYRGLRRDKQHISLRENSLSSRLRGRIRLSGRLSSPTDRDINMVADHGRLSPVRTSISLHQGRIQDKIKGKVEESFNNVGKDHRGQHFRRDTTGDNSAYFAGPKSLAELKNRKNEGPIRQHVTNQQSLGKRKHLITDGHQQSANDLSFEGPKPLEEILKRKRRETIGTINGRNSSNNQGIIENGNQEEKDATKNQVHSASLQTGAEESRLNGSNSTLQSVPSKLEAEDGVLADDGVDQEFEVYDQRGVKSNYEHVSGEEDFGAYNGESGYAAREYLDEEDDDDDFAKKMGVMHS